MIRKSTLLFLLCFGMQYVAQAQYCGSSKAEQRLISQDPVYAQRLQELTSKWVDWVHNAQAAPVSHGPHPSGFLLTNGTRKTIQIPIVIHVITTGGAVGTIYNPTDAQLLSMVDYLNQVYNDTWGAYPDTANGGVSIPIQFVLAQRDSNCNPTTGIERIDGSSVPGYVDYGVNNGVGAGASEVAVKNLSRWPVGQYYNVWVVNKIDSADGTGSGVFTAGYAYLPPAPSSYDGIIMLATQATSGNITIPHEMAHSLSVLHTFEGGDVNTCPANNNCLTDGDQICDTEPEMQSNFNCPVDPNPCTGGSYNNVQHNFMDYSSCQNRFTAGQRARMIMGLYNYRASFLGATGGMAPGLNAIAACIPTMSNPGSIANAGPHEFKIQDTYNTALIGNVPFVYLDYKSGGYNTDGNRSYLDLTCKQQATLAAGGTYKFSVLSGPNAAEKVRIYIDYNNDGSFSPAELVYSHDNTSANAVDSVNITMPSVATMPGLVTCTPIRMRVISDIAATVDPCNISQGQAEDYALVISGSGNANVPVTIALPVGFDTTCFNSQLRFTATPGTGAGAPITYKWYVNGVQIVGQNSNTFTSSAIGNNAVVTARMFYTNQCGAADSSLSNAVVVHRALTVPPRISIALTEGNNPGCAGITLTFTATPVNPGDAPFYQWYVNNVGIGGATGPTYTTDSLHAGDTVYCFMQSTSPCAVPQEVYSNRIGIQSYYLTSSITATATPNPACSGKNVVISSIPVNTGGSATYQWYLNGVPIQGANSTVYVSNTLQSGDILRIVMTTSDPCIANPVDTSNPVVMTVNTTLTPDVSAAITLGNNPGCLDSLVGFAGNANNFGIGPNYTWLVNGVPTANGQLFSSTTLQNGDVVTLRVNSTDGGCYSNDTIYSAPIAMVRAITPDPPLVSLIGNLLVTNVGGTVQWYGPNGPFLIPGATEQYYHPTERGTYYAVAVDSNCASGISNIIDITLLDVNNVAAGEFKAYPNPTSGQLTLDWAHNVNMKIIVYNTIGQGLLVDDVKGQSTRTLNLSSFPNGNYLVVMRNEEGQMSTVSVSLVR